MGKLVRTRMSTFYRFGYRLQDIDDLYYYDDDDMLKYRRDYKSMVVAVASFVLLMLRNVFAKCNGLTDGGEIVSSYMCVSVR